MAHLVKSLAVAAAAAGLLSACATYDGYGYSHPYYGYDYGPSNSYGYGPSYYYGYGPSYYGPYGYGYSPYYRDYGPAYYYGAPAIGFGFTYSDRNRHDGHYRDHNGGRRYDGDRRPSHNATSPDRTTQRQGATRPTTTRNSTTTPPAPGQRIAPAPVARSDSPQGRSSRMRQPADLRAEQRE